MPAMPLTPLKVFHHVQPALPGRVRDPRLQVEPLLEVDVDQVIAADGPRQGRVAARTSIPWSLGTSPGCGRR